MADARELLNEHHRLDHACRNRRGRLFVSDWYCEHPFAEEVIPATARNGLTADELLPYHFQNDTDIVHAEIQSFHRIREGRELGRSNIFVAAGLSPLITAQMLMLRRRGVRRIYYVRPLYYTYYFLAESLGMTLVPVNDNPLVDSVEELRLPVESDTWLVMCDPVWYMGRNIDHLQIDAIRQWQVDRSGMIIVDGAFQYQRWVDNLDPEPTSSLLPEQTLVNLCPTKSAAVHGPRFAYAVIPADLHEELRYCYANTAGSGSIFDRTAAASIMRWLNSAASNTILIDRIRQRHTAMTAMTLLTDPIGARASYFCFVSVPVDECHLITMDQRFFDTTSLPGLVRFNLLLPLTELTKYVRLAANARGQDSDEAVNAVLG
jgi:histidinol-phosphate/aromatic aminotransferase/cobyric acid decarboxylase-like protein